MSRKRKPQHRNPAAGARLDWQIQYLQDLLDPVVLIDPSSLYATAGLHASLASGFWTLDDLRRQLAAWRFDAEHRPPDESPEPVAIAWLAGEIAEAEHLAVRHAA